MAWHIVLCVIFQFLMSLLALVLATIVLETSVPGTC